MGDMLACLRGWHPGLAKAELAALMPDARLVSEASTRWVRVHGGSDARRGEALRIASGLQCFLLNAVVSTTHNTTIEAWLNSMTLYIEAHPVEGTVAVRTWKQGAKIPGWSTSELTRSLGGVLFERGYSIDLDTPDHVLALVADGPTASLACGWMEGDGQAAFSNGERRAGERPFFKPVSLDPMLARLAVNLATGPLENGPVVDPMTGTGGFLIEASLSGRNAIGIDVHSEMVQGAAPTCAGLTARRPPGTRAWYAVMPPGCPMPCPMSGLATSLASCWTRLTDETPTAAWRTTPCSKPHFEALETWPIQRQGLF